MKDDEILKRLNEVFCDVMDDEKIVLSHSTNASDIEEWDSLNQINIILAFDKAFGVRLNARDINLLENVGAMIEHLQPLVANKS